MPIAMLIAALLGAQDAAESEVLARQAAAVDAQETAPASADQSAAGRLPKVAAGRVTQMMFDDGAAAGVGEVWVWTPPGYGRDPRARYPVLYMHDGQNIFDPALTNYGKEWGIDEAITRMAMREDLREWIVVGIRSPENRWLNLFPEKLLDFLPAHRVAALAETAGTERIDRRAFGGDEYLKWMVTRLKPYIDRRYPTHKDAANTAVMGASMGGLMSLYAVAEYPEVFGQGAGLSTHFALGNPVEDEAAVPGHVADMVEAWKNYLNSTHIDPSENRLYVDHGTATLDAGYELYYVAFEQMMRAGGWPPGHFESRRFKGAEHDEDGWRERIDIPLAFLDRYDP